MSNKTPNKPMNFMVKSKSKKNPEIGLEPISPSTGKAFSNQIPAQMHSHDTD